MSKILKTLLFVSYTFVVIQYIKFSLSSIEEMIEHDYITHFTDTGQKKVQRKFHKFKHNLTAIQMNYKRPIRFATDLKFILKYTNSFLHYGTSLYKNGQSAFIYNKCKYKNCFLTNMVSTLADIRDYDAILFDVENNWDSVIVIRDPSQKYIFVASESAANYPLCDISFNSYYNMTWTYKLNSDIHLTYISILDKKGNIVGPKINMSWIQPMKPTPADVKGKLRTKKKAAAWFVSNCHAKSGRKLVTDALEKELVQYNLTIDIFGWCGTKSCPKGRFADCLELLETDYYFYLSFENSFAEDYVTEKILYPLQHYTVPIVYGGADYSRFLPPDSYFNARTMNASKLAKAMHTAIINHTLYEDYFKWHNHYEYISVNSAPDVCKLCEVLNTESDQQYSYNNFLHWWNPNYVAYCNHGGGRVLVEKKGNALAKEPLDLNDVADGF